MSDPDHAEQAADALASARALASVASELLERNPEPNEQLIDAIGYVLARAGGYCGDAAMHVRVGGRKAARRAAGP